MDSPEIEWRLVEWTPDQRRRWERFWDDLLGKADALAADQATHTDPQPHAPENDP